MVHIDQVGVVVGASGRVGHVEQAGVVVWWREGRLIGRGRLVLVSNKTVAGSGKGRRREVMEVGPACSI